MSTMIAWKLVRIVGISIELLQEYRKHIPITNGLVHKLSSNGAVNTTADGADHTTLFTTDGANTGDFLTNELFL